VISFNFETFDKIDRWSHREHLRGLFDGLGGELDGVALNVVQALINLDKERFTNGECLDLVGDVIDIWRGFFEE
jgi:hypothetical protein